MPVPSFGMNRPLRELVADFPWILDVVVRRISVQPAREEVLDDDGELVGFKPLGYVTVALGGDADPAIVRFPATVGEGIAGEGEVEGLELEVVSEEEVEGYLRGLADGTLRFRDDVGDRVGWIGRGRAAPITPGEVARSLSETSDLEVDDE